MNFNIKTIHQSRTSKVLPFYLSDLGKKIIKLSVIFLLLINLNGCALLGTILRVAPLAAIFVYYSAPCELDNGQLACIKTVRTYKKVELKHEVLSKNVKNQYYICLIDCKSKEVEELTQILDDKHYELDNAIIYKENGKIKVALDNPEGTWQLCMDGSNLRKTSDSKIRPNNYLSNKDLYAYLPSPKIKDILSN